MSEIETDKVKGCKREKERQDGGERKRRDEEEKKKKNVEAVQMVCTEYVCTVLVCIGTVWDGTVRRWYGMGCSCLFSTDTPYMEDGFFFIMISLLAKSTSHFAPQEVTQPSYL